MLCLCVLLCVVLLCFDLCFVLLCLCIYVCGLFAINHCFVCFGCYTCCDGWCRCVFYGYWFCIGRVVDIVVVCVYVLLCVLL